MKQVILILIISLSGSDLYADYLRVSRKASIKAAATSSSGTLASVEEDELLDLLDGGQQVNGYYHVRGNTFSGSGWIYRTFVRRYYGQMPQRVTDQDLIENPLRDPTHKLTDQERAYASRHLKLGMPQGLYHRVYEGYVTAQDARLKIPIWVQYELTSADLDGPATRRDNFRPDTSIPKIARAETGDYAGSNYDQGHMAPAEDMNRSEKVMDESFLLSNMAPQTGIGFNRHIWAYLESAIRGWVRQRGSLTVITGAVFQAQEKIVSYPVIGENAVAVPTHFYKIVVDANDPDDIQVLAFLIPNEKVEGGTYAAYLTSVRKIELLTGLDFLSALPKSTQDRIEIVVAGSVW